MTSISIFLLVGMILFLAPIIMLSVWWFRRKLSAGAPAPAGAPGEVARDASVYKNPLVWVAVGVAVILWFTVDRSLVLGAGVLVALAALALKGKGGTWAKVALGVTAVALLLFGSRSPDVLEKVQQKATGVVLDDKPIFSSAPSSGATGQPQSQAVQPPAAALGTPVAPSDGQAAFARYEFRVTSTHWSPRIPLTRGRCVAWFTEEPGSPGLVTRTTEKPFPQDDIPSDWEEHRDGEYAKTPRYFLQIRSAGRPVLAIAEIRPDGQCR